MTWAKRHVLRECHSGPQPVMWDYKQLLVGKLRAAWDVRHGGEFAPGKWISHRDIVSGIKLTAPSEAARPRAEADVLGYFRGQRVIRLSPTNHLKMVNENIPNLVPVGTRPEVFFIGRANTLVVTGGICGVADANASSTSGAQFDSDGAAVDGYVGGLQTAAFSDTASAHLFTADLGEDNRRRVRIDNAIVATSGATGAVNNPTTQAAVGGYATGFTTSADWYIAAWGVISPPMTDAERAQFYAIAREDWGF